MYIPLFHTCSSCAEMMPLSSWFSLVSLSRPFINALCSPASALNATTSASRVARSDLNEDSAHECVCMWGGGGLRQKIHHSTYMYCTLNKLHVSIIYAARPHVR